MNEGISEVSSEVQQAREELIAAIVLNELLLEEDE